jgi:hypothetical protein
MHISRETVIVMDWYASLVITVIRDHGAVLSVLYLVDENQSYLSTVAAFLWRHDAYISTFLLRSSGPIILLSRLKR